MVGRRMRLRCRHTITARLRHPADSAPNPTCRSAGYGVTGFMRALLACFAVTLAATADAQSPPRYSPYQRQYTPEPAVPRSGQPVSLAGAMLDAHNAIRLRVGLPPLSWSAALAEAAQDWADYLIASGTFFHSPDNRYGENLYAISGGAASPSDVVSAWASEGTQYDIRNDRCAGVCGHYTQIVWRTTRELGCAVAASA